MPSAVVAPLRKIINALVAHASPGQLAAGFTLGMNIGFIPKGNLIALSLCVLLFSLRCNKGMALFAAAIFTCVAPWADPFTHKLGLALLSIDSFQGCYASMFSLPTGPWWGFDNTVVTGSFALSLYLAYPVYWIVRMFCSVWLRDSSAVAASQPGVET